MPGRNVDGAQAVWREERSIESFDVDARGRLRPHVMLGHLLNSAWNHTRGTPYGYEGLTAQGRMWVLVKIDLRISRIPEWGEKLGIETWGKRIERLFALRDFLVSDESGEAVVRATSSWMILSRESGRPQRLSRMGEEFPWSPDREALKAELGKVDALQSGIELARFPVLHSDIDVNGHVNSTSYLRWMIDAHEHGLMQKRELAALSLSFLAEAMPEDRIAVFSEGSEAGELCCVRHAEDGTDFCRAMMSWDMG